MPLAAGAGLMVWDLPRLHKERLEAARQTGVLDLHDLVGVRAQADAPWVSVPLSHAVAPEIAKLGLGVHQLDLSGNQLDNQALSVLAPALARVRRVTHLNLADNHLDADAAVLLASALSPLTELRVLDLSWNKLDAASMQALAPALGKLTHLTHLNLGSNHLDAASAQALAPVLALLSSLECLDLSGNLLDGSAAAALAPALAPLRRVNELRLSSNHLRADTISMLEGAAGVRVGNVDKTFTRASTLWQIGDLITDIVFIVFVISTFSPARATSYKAATVVTGSYLLLWAILIGLVPFIRGTDHLDRLWSGSKAGVVAYKVFALFEGAIEILVVYAIRYGDSFQPIDFLFIGGTVTLLLLDLRFILRTFRAEGNWLPAGSMLAPVPFVVAPAVASRYVAWSWWPMILLAVAYTIAAFWASVLITADEAEMQVKFAGIHATEHFFSSPSVRILYACMSLPLLLPIIWLWYTRRRTVRVQYG